MRVHVLYGSISILGFVVYIFKSSAAADCGHGCGLTLGAAARGTVFTPFLSKFQNVQKQGLGTSRRKAGI